MFDASPIVVPIYWMTIGNWRVNLDRNTGDWEHCREQRDHFIANWRWECTIHHSNRSIRCGHSFVRLTFSISCSLDLLRNMDSEVMFHALYTFCNQIFELDSTEQSVTVKCFTEIHFADANNVKWILNAQNRFKLHLKAINDHVL